MNKIYISVHVIIFLFLSIIPACRTPSNQIILDDGYYFDGDKFSPFKEIIIENEKIKAINNVHSNVPGKHISINGRYIIPGLIDAHVHLQGCPVQPEFAADPEVNLNSCLSCGVTSIVDLCFNEYDLASFKNEVSKKPEYYATAILSGPMITAAGGHGTEYGPGSSRVITSTDEVEYVVDHLIKSGADVIKVVYQGHSNKHSLNKKVVKRLLTRHINETRRYLFIS